MENQLQHAVNEFQQLPMPLIIIITLIMMIIVGLCGWNKSWFCATTTTTIPHEKINFYLYQTALCDVGVYVMECVFSLGSQSKQPHETLKDYLINTRGMPKYNKTFNRTSRYKIEHDHSYKSFDITLWYSVIQWGCEGLADPNKADIWVKSPGTLENYLYKLKDERNNVMHDKGSLSDSEFNAKMDDLENLLVKIYNYAKNKFTPTTPPTNSMIRDISSRINKIRSDLWPVLDKFHKQQLIMEDVGRKDLLNLLEKWTSTNPASLIVGYNLQIDVSHLFIAMKLIKGGRGEQREDIDFLEFLAYAHNEETGNRLKVILLEGIAGSGKTTLIQKLMSDWQSRIKGESVTIKELDRYAFVILVEARNTSFDSLKDYISFLMHKARNYFEKDEDMLKCLLSFQCLIIVDGLDEMNRKSKKLIMQILELPQTDNITVICTTRPEKLEDYFNMASSRVGTVRIELRGIPEKLRPEFLTKYNDELINRKCSSMQTKDVINHYNRNCSRLTQHWELPLNLCLLNLLLAFSSDDTSVISTPVELMHHTHELMRVKLIQRLTNHEAVRDIHEHGRSEVLREGIDKVLVLLEEKALLGLSKDAMSLEEDTIRDLKATCKDCTLPHQEILSAFTVLDKSWTSTGMEAHVTFPHKSFQEYYSAKYIYRKVFEANGGERETILSTLQRFEADTPFEIFKYQNTLVMILGLLHIHNKDGEEEYVEEIINLLKETGIEDSEDWIRVLDNVQCNETAARLIGQIEGIMDNIHISDSSVFAYASLFKTIDPARVNVDIKGDPSRIPKMNEVLLKIGQNAIDVVEFQFQHLFKYPVDIAKNNEILPIIENILNRFEVERYIGPLIQGWILKESMEDLDVSLSDYNSLHRFQTQLRNRKRRFRFLCIRVFLRIEESRIDDILPLRGDIGNLILQIPDVTSPADAANASLLAGLLVPTTGYKSFGWIHFPRCQMKDEQLTPLVQSLKGIKVTSWISFPSSSKPSSEERKENLNILAEDATGCKYGIRWMDDFDFLW